MRLLCCFVQRNVPGADDGLVQEQDSGTEHVRKQDAEAQQAVHHLNKGTSTPGTAGSPSPATHAGDGKPPFNDERVVTGKEAGSAHTSPDEDGDANSRRLDKMSHRDGVGLLHEDLLAPPKTADRDSISVVDTSLEQHSHRLSSARSVPVMLTLPPSPDVLLSGVSPPTSPPPQAEDSLLMLQGVLADREPVGYAGAGPPGVRCNSLPVVLESLQQGGVGDEAEDDSPRHHARQRQQPQVPALKIATAHVRGGSYGGPLGDSLSLHTPSSMSQAAGAQQPGSSGSSAISATFSATGHQVTRAPSLGVSEAPLPHAGPVGTPMHPMTLHQLYAPHGMGMPGVPIVRVTAADVLTGAVNTTALQRQGIGYGGWFPPAQYAMPSSRLGWHASMQPPGMVGASARILQTTAAFAAPMAAVYRPEPDSTSSAQVELLGLAADAQNGAAPLHATGDGAGAAGSTPGSRTPSTQSRPPRLDVDTAGAAAAGLHTAQSGGVDAAGLASSPSATTPPAQFVIPATSPSFSTVTPSNPARPSAASSVRVTTRSGARGGTANGTMTPDSTPGGGPPAGSTVSPVYMGGSAATTSSTRAYTAALMGRSGGGTSPYTTPQTTNPYGFAPILNMPGHTLQTMRTGTRTSHGSQGSFSGAAGHGSTIKRGAGATPGTGGSSISGARNPPPSRPYQAHAMHSKVGSASSRVALSGLINANNSARSNASQDRMNDDFRPRWR